MSPVEILLEQYRIAEQRRAEFGRQFMQTAGFVSALFGIAIGLIHANNPALLRAACGVGGSLFIVIAFLGYRLGKRQDDCEDTLAEIECALRASGQQQIVSL